MNTAGKAKLICLAGYSDTEHLITKIRETYNDGDRTGYIEIYLNKGSYGNEYTCMLEDALGTENNWRAIQPEKTEESVAHFEVRASLDLPDNFDISDLLSKSGNAASATKATQDEDGNNIVDTYAKKGWTFLGEAGPSGRGAQAVTLSVHEKTEILIYCCNESGNKINATSIIPIHAFSSFKNGNTKIDIGSSNFVIIEPIANSNIKILNDSYSDLVYIYAR